MARIMAIDYGTKRIGLATTDPLQIIASPLDTVATEKLLEYLKNYFAQEEVSTVIVGEPLHADGNPTNITQRVHDLVHRLRKTYPDKKFILQDEHFTSKNASLIILNSGLRKKKRRDKSLIDKVSAALILKEYMENNVW